MKQLRDQTPGVGGAAGKVLKDARAARKDKADQAAQPSGGSCAECGAPSAGGTCKYCGTPTAAGPASKPGAGKGGGAAKAAGGAAAGAAIGQAANAAASEFGPNVADSLKRVKDAGAEARAQGKSVAGAVAAEGATEVGAEVASKFGVPKTAVREGAKPVKKIIGVVATCVAALGMFVIMLIFVIAAMQEPSAPEVWPSLAERTEVGEPKIQDHQRDAAVSNDLPPGILWALSLAATENGKFSPYSDDTVDRAPEYPGVRRPSAGASSAGETPDPNTANTAGGAVAVVGDSLCEPGAAGDALRAELETAGLTVTSSDCVRGRPLTGAGVDALSSVGSGVTTIVVSLGTNDLSGGDAAKFAESVRAAVAAAPRVNFVWINFAASAHAEAAAAFNAELTKIAAETPHLTVADVASQVAANPSWQAGDGVHLTAAGYSARAKAAATAAAAAGGATGASGAWPPNPDDVEVSVWPTVSPAIGDPATQPAGPYLIQPRALAGADIDAQAFEYTSVTRPRTATDLIASELAEIRDSLINDGRSYAMDDTESLKEFWTEAVSRLPVADPRSVQCKTPDRGPAADSTEQRLAVAVAITDLWYCEIGNAEAFRTLTGVSRSNDRWTDQLSASNAAHTVTREAAQVAWAFSKWGTETCDANAELAGVFPLTAAVFDKYADTAEKAKGRCDHAANIRAAARAFIATEKIAPGERADGAETGGIGDRSGSLGPYAPMLGGWLAMPWALGGTDAITEFAATGPGSSWEPSDECAQQIDAWLAAASDDDTWADGAGDITGAPTCDAPEGGGPDDAAWVAWVSQRAAAAAAVAATAAELAGDDAWAAEQERDTDDDSTTTTTAPENDGHDHNHAVDPADAERRAANLNGISMRIGGGTGNTGRAPIARVTTNGGTPADMPPLLEVDRSESGTRPYAEIVVEIAYELGGLVSNEGVVYTDTEADPLALLAEFTMNSPASAFGGAFGALGDEIPFAAVFNAAGNTHGIDPRMIAAVAHTESGFSDDVIFCTRTSSAGARGIMQFMPATAAGRGIDPCKPEEAIPAGAAYLKEIHGMFGDWTLAFAGYNAGPGNVRKHGGVPPITETRNYVVKVNAKWEEYKAKYPDQIPVGPIMGGGNFAAVPGGKMVNTASRGQICVVPIPSSPGTIVNCNIAGAVEAMFAQAARDGITLRGSAHRPVEIQIQLRAQRCPGRVYDSSCKGSPPTALPGRSMHELGEAIDFSTKGRSLNRGDAEFAWLNANAATYGLINWPVEPWHWSTNGK